MFSKPNVCHVIASHICSFEVFIRTQPLSRTDFQLRIFFLFWYISLGGGGGGWLHFDVFLHSCTEDLSIYPHRCCLNLGPTLWQAGALTNELCHTLMNYATPHCGTFFSTYYPLGLSDFIHRSKQKLHFGLPSQKDN
jgi:hypothetical protein